MLTNSLYITFHGIGEPAVSIGKDEARYFVSKKVYKEVISSLAEVEHAFGIKIQVTFDDGNMSDLRCGLPVLVDAGRTAVFFILAGRIGETGYLDAGDIRTLLDAGMTIGSHGHDHVDWRALDDVGRQREFVEARDRLAQVIGHPVEEVALPFGRFDRDVLTQLKVLGYRRVYTSARGTTTPASWFCPRTSITCDFEPKRDLAVLCSAKARFEGWLLAHARKVKYGH